nr:cullin-9-like [Aotus nancymaae]
MYAAPEPMGPCWGQADVPFCGSQSKTSKPSPEAVATLASLQLPAGRTMSPQEVEGLMEQTVRQVQETLNLEPDVAQHLLAHSHWGTEQLLQSYSEDPEPLLLAAGLCVPQAQAAPVRPDHCPVCVSPLGRDDDLPSLCCMHYCCKVRPHQRCSCPWFPGNSWVLAQLCHFITWAILDLSLGPY